MTDIFKNAVSCS